MQSCILKDKNLIKWEVNAKYIQTNVNGNIYKLKILYICMPPMTFASWYIELIPNRF
jgi:hypothetical protein